MSNSLFCLATASAWFSDVKSDFNIWFSDFKAQFKLNFIDDNRYQYLLEGLKNTLIITFFAALIGIAIGIVVAAIRTTYDKNKDTFKMRNKGVYRLLSILNVICKIYLTVLRGTPVVVQLMIMYFIIMASSTNNLLVAILAFGINSGAYVAEIFRGGIMSIDNGQFEAGRSLGFSYIKTMWFIIIPQVVKNVLPTLLNESIALLKETSVAGYVGIKDLTKGGDTIRGTTYSAFMPLIAVAIMYLIVVMFFTFLVGRIERRLKVSER